MLPRGVGIAWERNNAQMSEEAELLPLKEASRRERVHPGICCPEDWASYTSRRKSPRADLIPVPVTPWPLPLPIGAIADKLNGFKILFRGCLFRSQRCPTALEGKGKGRRQACFLEPVCFRKLWLQHQLCSYPCCSLLPTLRQELNDWLLRQHRRPPLCFPFRHSLQRNAQPFASEGPGTRTRAGAQDIYLNWIICLWSIRTVIAA